MINVTYRPAVLGGPKITTLPEGRSDPAPYLTCEFCGAVVENSEGAQNTHTAFHQRWEAFFDKETT